MPSLPEDGDDEAPHPDAASSNSRPGFPVTEGEFPIAQSPDAPDSDSDSDATIDYEGQGLASEDVFFAVPKCHSFPDIPLLGDESFEDFMTLLAGKVKATVITQEMQRKYAKQIRKAKLEEFKSYLDNGAIHFLDKRTLKFGPGGTNYLTGRWVLTVKVDKGGNFTKFKARWVCRGFQDKRGWEQTDSPTATRYGFRLVCQQAASSLWDLLHLDLKAAFLQGEHCNLSRRAVIIQLLASLPSAILYETGLWP